MNNIICGDALTELRRLDSESVNCCVTSPPYWGLRDYGVDNQLGLEKTPEEYVEKMVEIFREIRRVLRKDGTVWFNLGDSYWGSGKGYGCDWENSPKQKTNTGSLFSQTTKPATLDLHSFLKPKDLCMIPARVALALQADGWWLRQDIIWSKPNPMPESVTDRCTKAHEYIFLLTKSAKYYYDADAIKEPAQDRVSGSREMAYNEQGLVHKEWKAEWGRNKRSVWEITTQPFPEAHFAVYPEALIKPCILAGCPERGIVLDPFIGSGTTAKVARDLNRQYVGVELNPEYIKIIDKRLQQQRAAI